MADTGTRQGQDELTIDWGPHSDAQWQKYLISVSRSNLLQTWPYAQAVRSAQQRSTRFGLIRSFGEPVGMFEIQELRLLGFHYVALHRGPLWFDDANDPASTRRFFAAFARQFPARPGRVRRLLPEIEAQPQAERMLADLGFRRHGPGYQTMWVDLRPEPDEMRARLAQKWRNRLNAAERSELRCVATTEPAAVEWVIARYMADRKAKRYRGPSPATVRALVGFFGARDNVLLLRAVEGGKPVAAVLLLIHGRAATYQIGWTDSSGRDLSATNLLLWQAMLRLRARDVEWLDVGGVHPEAAPGLTRFKCGLGGTPYVTVGSYR